MCTFSSRHRLTLSEIYEKGDDQINQGTGLAMQMSASINIGQSNAFRGYNKADWNAPYLHPQPMAPRTCLTSDRDRDGIFNFKG